MAGMTKALLTGGTGFIGSHLAEALAAAGIEVYALVRDPGRIKFLSGIDVRLVAGDLATVPALPPGLDWVFHLAGLTKALKKEEYYNVNQKGTASFFEALAAQGQRPRIIHVSSLAAAGPSDKAAGRTEEDPASPVSPYGRSKLAGEGEALARKDRFPLVLIRVGAVFGPRDQDFLKFFRTVAKGFLPAFGRRPQPMCVCYVRDLVEALLLAARADLPSGTILNIGNAAPSDFLEIGRISARLLGRRVRRLVIPLPAVGAIARLSDGWSRISGKPTPVNRHKYRDLRQPGWTADVSKARTLLGFEARTPLDEAIRETLDWYRAQGLI
jgi:nucleoside-diphosphate-sugar epimerase